jgi:hypothetical protein
MHVHVMSDDLLPIISLLPSAPSLVASFVIDNDRHPTSLTIRARIIILLSSCYLLAIYSSVLSLALVSLPICASAKQPDETVI